MAILGEEKVVEGGKDKTVVARDGGVVDPLFFRPAAFALKGHGGGPAIYTLELRSLCGSKQQSSR